MAISTTIQQNSVILERILLDYITLYLRLVIHEIADCSLPLVSAPKIDKPVIITIKISFLMNMEIMKLAFVCRDDPKDEEMFMVSNKGKQNGELEICGDNLFAAI